jgi:TonB family protein
MAIAPPLEPPHARAPDTFVEALNGLVVGIVSLDFTRRTLGAALSAEPRARETIQALVASAWEEGRLGDEDYEALIGDLGHKLSEDEPTEWSEDVVSEVAPTSDTVRRQADGNQARAATLYPGAILRERFVLQSRVDASGMSVVYKALDRRRQEAGADNPFVAIKLVGPATPRYQEALRLLQQEAALAQRLEHTHIVRVFDFDRDGDLAFITMEWLEGESLADLLTRQRHRPLTPAHARQILAEIGAALQFAHGRAVTHADVKPANIFLTRDGGAKLLDFGIARPAAAEPGATLSDARTPAYASCEVLDGAAPTAQDDVYSLACVAYRMFAGHRVFGHDDALAAERAGRRPARIRRLRDAQWQALERALAYRRAARTADVQTFLREFEAADVAAAPLAVARPADASARPDVAPARAWLALAAGIAALALAITLWRGPGEEPAESEADAGTAREAPTAATPPALPDTPPRAAPAPSPAPTAPAPPPTVARRETATPKPVATATKPKPATAKTAAPQPARPAPAGAPVVAAPTPGQAPLPSAPSPAVAVVAPSADAAPAAAVPTEPAPTAEPAGPKQVMLSTLNFRRYVEPTRPRSARGPDPVGWVELTFIVGTDGATREARILDSAPPGHYDQSALAAVKRWRFRPVTEDGRPVERRTDVRLRFQPE